MKIFLHIGAGKCASSSIQRYFAYNHTQGSFGYACVEDSGLVLSGNLVELRAVQSSVGYASSDRSPFGSPMEFRNSLSLLSNRYSTLLFSCEAWSWQHADFLKNASVFEGHEVEVIFVVRPFVEWYNSAWWQWYNWDRKLSDVDAWLEKSLEEKIERAAWLNNYQAFKSLPYVRKVHLLALQEDIIEQVHSIVGLDRPQIDRAAHNTSASAEHLHFLSLNKHLRKAHGVGLDFIFNRLFTKRSATPWVLSRENVCLILEKTKEETLELAKCISNEDIVADKRWWEASAYKEKLARLTRDISLTDEVIVDLLDEAESVIANLKLELKEYRTNSELLADACIRIEALDNDIRAFRSMDFVQSKEDLRPLFPQSTKNRDKNS